MHYHHIQAVWQQQEVASCRTDILQAVKYHRMVMDLVAAMAVVIPSTLHHLRRCIRRLVREVTI